MLELCYALQNQLVKFKGQKKQQEKLTKRLEQSSLDQSRLEKAEKCVVVESLNDNTYIN